MPKLGQVGKWVRISWGVSKCGAGEGWRRVVCSDRVKNVEVLQRVKEERNIVHATLRKKANWISHISRRNCLLKQVIEGKIEGRTEATERGGTGCKQLIQALRK
jgi:hypothetical protein